MYQLFKVKRLGKSIIERLEKVEHETFIDSQSCMQWCKNNAGKFDNGDIIRCVNTVTKKTLWNISIEYKATIREI